MSIYGTIFVLADDEPPDDDTGLLLGAPFAYLGSHVLPGPQAPRQGDVQLASIPGFITRADDPRSEAERAQAEADGDYQVHPYLRLSVHGWNYRTNTDVDVTVVLNRWQVAAVRDALTRWVETPKTNTGEWTPPQVTAIGHRYVPADLPPPPAEE